MSDVYADISALIDDEQEELREKITEADGKLEAEIEAAQQEHDTTVSAIRVRQSSLDSLRAQVQSLAGQAASDPQVPSVPADTDATSSDSTPPAEPSSADESSETAPSDSSPSTPTTPDASPSEPSAPVEPVTQPDAIPLAEVPDAVAAGVPSETPVAVPTTTGEIKVVTVDDVIVASDTSVPTSELTEAQQLVRNSDLP